MKHLLLMTLLLVGAGAVLPSAAHARCDYDSDIAADGSRCGGRSAESRPGGYNPYTGYGR